MTKIEELITLLIVAVDMDAWNGGRTHRKVEARQALLDALPAWQPMDTAPKDGSEIVVRKGDEVFIVSWGDENDWFETNRYVWRKKDAVDTEFGICYSVENPDAWLPVADLLALPMR